MGWNGWIRGVALLRHSVLVKDLGERRLRLLELEELRRRFPAARVTSDVRLLSFDADRIALGREVTICDGTILSFGDDVNGFGRIDVGDRTWIGQYNNLRAGGGDIHIGCDCLISQFCTLVGTNHSICRELPIREQGSDKSRCGVVMEDDVWLGAGVVVVSGVKIRRGAVIGANAVVTHDVPEFEIWGGVPAKKLGERSDDRV